MRHTQLQPPAATEYAIMLGKSAARGSETGRSTSQSKPRHERWPGKSCGFFNARRGKPKISFETDAISSCRAFSFLLIVPRCSESHGAEHADRMRDGEMKENTTRKEKFGI